MFLDASIIRGYTACGVSCSGVIRQANGFAIFCNYDFVVKFFEEIITGLIIVSLVSFYNILVSFYVVHIFLDMNFHVLEKIKTIQLTLMPIIEKKTVYRMFPLVKRFMVLLPIPWWDIEKTGTMNHHKMFTFFVQQTKCLFSRLNVNSQELRHWKKITKALKITEPRKYFSRDIQDIVCPV